jgi:hypothetical protein
VADRYDLKTARTGRDGKTYWTRIGVMFPMRDRDGFNITLEAMPLQSMNEQGQLECRITAWEPYKDDQGSVRGEPSAASSASDWPDKPDTLDDDVIPF